MVVESMTIVENFCRAFKRKDPDELLDFFSDDATYHNMPIEQPARGKAQIRRMLEAFLAPAEAVEFEVIGAAANGSSVFTERVDRFVLGGRSVSLPIAGVFEIENGKISAWRDYFDLATWTKQQPPNVPS
jgi:limonene-1,2-epoxide hydrolase